MDDVAVACRQQTTDLLILIQNGVATTVVGLPDDVNWLFYAPMR